MRSVRPIQRRIAFHTRKTHAASLGACGVAAFRPARPAAMAFFVDQFVHASGLMVGYVAVALLQRVILMKYSGRRVLST